MLTWERLVAAPAVHDVHVVHSLFMQAPQLKCREGDGAQLTFINFLMYPSMNSELVATSKRFRARPAFPLPVRQVRQLVIVQVASVSERRVTYVTCERSVACVNTLVCC